MEMLRGLGLRRRAEGPGSHFAGKAAEWQAKKKRRVYAIKHPDVSLSVSRGTLQLLWLEVKWLLVQKQQHHSKDATANEWPVLCPCLCVAAIVLCVIQ